jgi:putative membrane protein
MIETAPHGPGASAPQAPAAGISAPHATRSDHLSNERTHLAYLRTAISLISLGIALNRFSLYLEQQDQLPARAMRIDILGGTATAGVGMVLFALALMLVALHRYVAVDDAIENGTEHRDRPLVVTLTVSVLILGALGVLWMFRR